MPMQHHFGFRKRWDEAAYRRLIASQGWVGSAQHFMNIKSISINESLFQELPWYVETNRSQIRGRSKCLVGDFFNIECEFGSNVTVRTLVIGHGGSKLAP